MFGVCAAAAPGEAPVSHKRPTPPSTFALSAFATMMLTAPWAAAQPLPGDAAAGERAYRQCAACHSVEPGQHCAGPSLFGIYGSNAAQAEGFRYSRAMREADIVWNSEALAAYLIDPRGFLPGTSMRIALRDADDAADVIAYLRTLTDD